MQAAFNNIVQHLFHQPSLHSVTVDELENMAEQHPYFAAAHFLLLKKMQDTSHAGFGEQLLKTTLYFNNPLWLQYLLQPESAGNFKVLDKSPFITSDNESLETGISITAYQQQEEEILAVKEPQADAIANNVMAHQEELPVVASSGIMDVITEVFNDKQEETPVITEPVSSETNEVTKEESILSNNNNIVTDQDSHQQEHVQTESYNEVKEAAQQPARPNYESIIEQIRQANKAENVSTEEQVITGSNNETVEPIKNASADNAVTETSPLHSPALFLYQIPNLEEKQQEDESALVAEQPKTEETIQETPSTVLFAYDIPNIEETKQVEEVLPLVAEQAAPEEVIEQNYSPVLFKYDIPGIEAIKDEASLEEPILAENQPNEDAIPSLLGQQLSSLKTIIETPDAKDDVLFEPFHTVDYFASQGIKLSKLDANPKDKLGKQLKSFTEWLKSMKKLPQVSIDKILSENDESKVVADAIHSIENKEVITEAMAEVFEKQGLFDRAAGVYQKLSLLNPDKSAYFAAKIDALKQN
ncbi:MAG: hypothetical protein QM726_16080 [Chitinophagaceae bacterium]